MNIKALSCACVAALLCSSVTGWAVEKENPEEKLSGNVALREGEIEGLKIKKEWASTWSDESPALEQSLDLMGVDILWVKYRELKDKDEAQKALDHYRKDVSDHFFKGLWDDESLKLIGDECWFHEMGDIYSSLLIRSGKICFIISCHQNGNKPNRRSVALLLAKRIVEKAEAGGHVIIPKEKK